MRRLSKRVLAQILQKGPTSCSWQQVKLSNRKMRRLMRRFRLLLFEGELSNGIQKLILKFHPKTNYYRQDLHTFRGDVRLSYIVTVLPCKYIGLRHSHVTGSSLASGFSRAFPTPPDVSHDSLCIHLISAYN